MSAFSPALHKAAKAVRKVIWKPMPGSQEMFLRLGQPEFLVTELLFHGSRGNGKSDALIMGFVQHVGRGWGAYWRGIIFRKEYKNLEDIIATSHKIIPRAFPGAKWIGGKSCKWVFPDGEVLMFGHIKKHGDYEKFHGWQLTYIGWDELATWATPELYESMMSTLRTAYIPTPEQPELPPLQVRATTNPWGIGRGWVYKRFIEARRPGEIVLNEDGTRQRCALFGTIFENIYINRSYIKNFLMKLVDPAKRAAWLLGDWNAVDTSSMFGAVWSSRVVMKPFSIPKGWRIDRSFDFGQSTPYCGLWHAEANGEAATLPDGTRFCPPAGSIIVIGEDYGTEENARGEQVTPDAGLFLPARAIGKRLKDREKRLTDSGILTGHTIHPGAADSQIYNGKQIQGQQTVAAELEAEGMKFVPADKAPGSRVNSAQLAFQRLSATKLNSPDSPHLYIFQGCRYLIGCLPSIARDEDNMDACKKGPDDHAWDALAYRLTMKKSVTKVTNGIR
ncbi:hypothetical protein [Pseudomonas sp. URMO17WK12:I11]|uniref:hypothetical protein n=1 Tax=Pseudomonas sp. URMO17WK12:I11 TaxID=1283291 RepID=UPI00119E9A75|nr:hypothetical protein [Pseudomonas sp. URMO17WK12:I11]